MHPQPRVQCRKHTSVVTTSSPVKPGIPAREWFTASFVLSPVIGPVIGLVCHRHLARLLARLDAGVEASGPHDFAVRFSTVRQCASRVHRIPTRVDDVGQRPSVGQDTRLVELICPTGKAEYFFGKDWTGRIALIRLSNLAFRCNDTDS
jgi:hypothetical protein